MLSSPAAPPGLATTVEEGFVAERRRLQRRTMAVLTISQIVGGTGIGIGVAVGALLAARVAGTALSGLAQSALIVGTALFAVPVTRLMTRRGRRPGLGLGYLVGAAGAVLVLAAAAWRSVPLLFVGFFLFGAGSTANLQSRYAAVDLAEPARRGQQLSFVVWATAVGSVAGPNLAPLADQWLQRRGVAEYSGPFLFSGLAYTLAAVIVLLALRPDPLLTARTLAAASPDASRTAADPALADRTDSDSGVGDRTASDPGVGDRTADASGMPDVSGAAAAAGRADRAGSSGLRAAAREVAASPGARLGLAAMAVGQIVMISIMVMTPVHIGEAGHADNLRVVGLVISVHIAGMYALSPVTGWLTDRLGRRAVILGGVGLLVAACATAGLSGHYTVGLTVGLFLLGTGWSATMVSGSTLLTDSVGLANRASVQGLSDLVTGLGGAAAGALAGVVVAWSSYATLTVVAAVATIPLLAAVLRPARLEMSG